MAGLTKDVDVVVHLAAAVGVMLIVEQPLESLLTNIRGTEIVLDAAASYGRKILITSTSEIYGRNASRAVSEDADRILGGLREVGGRVPEDDDEPSGAQRAHQVGISGCGRATRQGHGPPGDESSNEHAQDQHGAPSQTTRPTVADRPRAPDWTPQIGATGVGLQSDTLSLEPGVPVSNFS